MNEPFYDPAERPDDCSREEFDAAMVPQHTPGPWDYDRAPQDFDGGGSPAYCTVTAESGEIIIAEVNDKIAEGAANARLIAAAPELLEMLERCEMWLSTAPDGRAMQLVCQALIAKATGEEESK